MIATEAGRLLGALRMDARLFGESEAAESPPRWGYQPDGVHLQNDGRWFHWMAPGHGYDYDIRHDGTGWQVTCRAWPGDGHVYRLATLGADPFGPSQFADRLPLADGDVTLEPGRTYALRETRPGAWALYEA